MMHLQLNALRWLWTLLLISIVAACGGGGGGGGGDAEITPGSSNSYTGSSEMAALNQDNVQDYTVGSFSAVTHGAVDIKSVSVESPNASEKAGTDQRRGLLSIVRTAVQRIDSHGPKQYASPAKAGKRTKESSGSCGGSLFISMDMNDSSGDFKGTFTCKAYCNNGVTLSGDGHLSGNSDSGRQSVQIRMTFPSLSMEEKGRSQTINGWIDVRVEGDGDETVQMDVTMQDAKGGKAYWMNDLKVASKSGAEPVHKSTIVTGRYYDSEHGYVDIHTDTPLDFNRTDRWPVSGVLRLEARNNTWVRMTFKQLGICRFEADLDGDDRIDWELDYSFATSFPVKFLSSQWNYGIFGTHIGQSGLEVVNVDNDGAMEIIAPASPHGSVENRFFYVARKTDAGEYEQVWFSPVFESPIVALQAVDMDKDERHEIYVGLRDGTINIFNLETNNHTAFSSHRLEYITAMAIGDIDGDGSVEIVVSDGGNLYAFSGDTFDLLWSIMARNLQSLAIGNVDEDPRPEIVVTETTGQGYVLNGNDRRELLNGCGRFVSVGDVDNDGMDEIVSAVQDRITIFDGDVQEPNRIIPVDGNINALKLVDVDGDQAPEIIYVDDQLGAVHCRNGATHHRLWSIDNPGQGIGAIAIGDLDDDNVFEVVLSAGRHSTEPERLYVADTQSRAIEWSSTHLRGPLSAVDVGDVDGDGQDEIVMAANDISAGNGGVIQIFDARTHLLEWTSVGVPDFMDAWHSVGDLKLGDVDGDGDTEIVIAAETSGDGKILIYDGSTHSLERSSNDYSQLKFTRLALGDVDNDDQQEIVVGQGWGQHIAVFNGRTADEEWQSDVLNSEYGVVINDIVLADIDSDGNPEIIVSGIQEEVIVFDGVTHQLDRPDQLKTSAVAVSDIDADGTLEILAVQSKGVAVYDGLSFTLEKKLTPQSSGEITALSVCDMNGDGAQEVILSAEERLMVYNSGMDRLIFRSGAIGRDLVGYNQFLCRDTDGDGLKEVVTGLKSMLVHLK